MSRLEKSREALASSQRDGSGATHPAAARPQTSDPAGHHCRRCRRRGGPLSSPHLLSPFSSFSVARHPHVLSVGGCRLRRWLCRSRQWRLGSGLLPTGSAWTASLGGGWHLWSTSGPGPVVPRAGSGGGRR
ncbi:hypothetical protein SEVIR_5G085350v4 [Setaria viridis]